MLEASFDAVRNRGASISGAYQYDTGQRIRMYGLPGPDELAGMDEALGSGVVTVQAQYARDGDGTTQPRLARYEEDTGAWLADVPDAVMMTSEPVHVYVYVSYGTDTDLVSSRNKTMYEGVFTPISRPAPQNSVTPDQLNAWDKLVVEVNMALTEMGTAISNANAAKEAALLAAQEASTAAENANAAAEAANTAGNAWGNATASAEKLEPGSEPTVTLSDNEDGTKHIKYGLPQGEKGDKGDTGPAGVTFKLEGTVLYITTDK